MARLAVANIGQALGALGTSLLQGAGFGIGYGAGIRVGYQDVYPAFKGNIEQLINLLSGAKASGNYASHDGFKAGAGLNDDNRLPFAG